MFVKDEVKMRLNFKIKMKEMKDEICLEIVISVD